MTSTTWSGRAAAVLAAGALALSGCTPTRPSGQESASSPAASGSSSPSGTIPHETGAEVRTTAQDVAGFDPAAHKTIQRWTSPDRTTVASEAQPEGFAAPPPGQGRQRYLDQKIDWKNCDAAQCAKVLVPLDWDHPDGPAITLSLKRKPATSGKAAATLFINPGGPGGSGTEMVDTFANNNFEDHDVLGWDPRGSGESTPVQCGTPAETDAYLATDNSPDDKAEWEALVKANKDFAAQCRKASGALLDHISTIDNVRDLDYLRELVGDKKLDYLGISYGTFIGAMYAEMYPQRTGRLVLDSAVNITEDDSVIQAMGFDLALKNYATWCAQTTCGLGDDQAAVITSVTGLLGQLDAKPLKHGKRELTQSLGVTGMVTYLYWGAQGYEPLTQALLAVQKGIPAGLVYTADAMNGRNSDGSYGPMAYAFPGIACADSADPGEAGARTELAADTKKAPILAPYFGPNLACTFWTARPAPQIDITGKGAAPILVLGATGDPATPYRNAQLMADKLDSAVLLTWKGAGHSVWDLGNDCAKNAVTAYVNKGTVPKDKTVC
ncbi:alpha/beta hydrolase [Luteococcus peritonei]|uniref:Alpha/beta hydrolase n=1 Tax=Luteococcus peritonei TaxID=88874 RepID=A0ABW4RWR8_9ACTN